MTRNVNDDRNIADYDDDYLENRTVLDQVADSARANPVPIALIGASVAWMLFGQRTGTAASRLAGAAPVRRTRRALANASRATAQSVGRTGEIIGEAGETAAERVSRTADAVASGAADLADGVGDRVGQLTDEAGRVLDDVGDRAASTLDAAGRSVRRLPREGSRFAANNPLAAATLGLAAGAGLAAILPRTQFEDELIGDQRGDLLQAAKDKTVALVSDGVDAARESTTRSVEQAAQRAAREAADQVLNRTGAVGDAVKDALDAVSNPDSAKASGSD